MSSDRVLEVNPGEKAVVLVRSEEVLTIVFGRMQLEVFEKSGRLYTVQGIAEMPVESHQPSGTPYEVRIASGSFDDVNRNHADTLEEDDWVATQLEFDPDEDDPYEAGGTQAYEPLYSTKRLTRMGFHCPYYLRSAAKNQN